jgi:hypothetical protein
MMAAAVTRNIIIKSRRARTMDMERRAYSSGKVVDEDPHFNIKRQPL